MGALYLWGVRTQSFPPHVPASHLMIPRRIHSLLDVPSKPLSLASTARDSPGVHLDIEEPTKTMSACGESSIRYGRLVREMWSYP